MCTILCSTGALIGRPNNRDYRLLKTLSKQLTCDGYEFMMKYRFLTGQTVIFSKITVNFISVNESFFARFQVIPNYIYSLHILYIIQYFRL